MTQLYLNPAQDFLIINSAADWLLLNSDTSTFPPTPPVASDFPQTPAPMEITITSHSPTFVSVTHGLRRQARSRGGHAWQLELRYGGMTQAGFAPLWAFLNKQAGQYGIFTVYLPGLLNRGAGGGTPRVNGASQIGTSLITDGWPNTVTVLRAGDFFQIENDVKVYQVTADALTSGAGAVTLSIFPPLRASPIDNMAIATTPVFLCALMDDSLPADFNQCVQTLGFTLSLAEIQI